tara:strand:- start:954 stop:1538 length:585 start_codon:yes stop_codon:yes gene_type:complete
MKRLLLIIILTFSFQLLTKADDIRDFEIEGLSIGDSLLKKFNEKKIINKIKNSNQYYKDNDYLLISFKIKSEKFDYLRFHVKSGDKDYLIQHIGGYKIIDFYNCKNKKKIISDELNLIFGANKRQDSKIKNHAYDKTGKSKSISNYFNLSTGRIRIMCTDWSSKLTTEKNWKDNLQVSIYSNKFADWLNNRAYK